jgi:hypothetical protein
LLATVLAGGVFGHEARDEAASEGVPILSSIEEFEGAEELLAGSLGAADPISDHRGSGD